MKAKRGVRNVEKYLLKKEEHQDTSIQPHVDTEFKLKFHQLNEYEARWTDPKSYNPPIQFEARQTYFEGQSRLEDAIPHGEYVGCC